jgi:hypothetical protein
MRIGHQDREGALLAAQQAKACAVVIGACLLLLGAAGFMLYRAQGVRRGGVKINPPVYSAPPLPPPLPAAGHKFLDPTFGTEIMRVTDEHTAAGANGDSSYPYWPTFNKDSTRMIVRLPTIGQARFAKLNATSFTISSLMTPANSPDGGQPDWGEALWSGTNKETLIVHNVLGRRFFLYNVATNSYNVLANLAKTLGVREYIYQASRSIDDDRIAFTIRRDDSATNGNYPIVGFAVWRVSTASLLCRVNTTDLNEVQIDKSGRYVLWVTEQNAGTAGANVFKVVDLDARPISAKALTVDAPDYAMNHYAVGTGKFICGPIGYSGTAYLGLTLRTLSAPHTYFTILQFSPAYFGAVGGSADHISWENDDESWFEVEHYSKPGGSWYPFRDEIILVEAKTGGRVRRLLHHHSVFADYYDQPRSNISRDGRFIAFTSNWGGNRRDLFIARIEPETVLTPRIRPRRVTRE